MATQELAGKRIAILVADGFEQVELTEPMRALKEAGARVAIVSPQRERVLGWKEHAQGDSFAVDVFLDEANAYDFDGLLLPGGALKPAALRSEPEAAALVRAFVDLNLPVAAIGYGPLILIDAGAVNGRTLTSDPSLRAELEQAGANWIDEEAVVDGKLVTSRQPADIAAFNREMVATFARGQVGQYGSLTPSSAPGVSFEDSPTDEGLGDDPAEMAGNTLSNPQIKGPEHLDPYYPSGTGPLSTPTDPSPDR